ncbi:FYVE zinc finger-domain-containing protein [Xylariaceae sp. FL1019]|nr:FYVE zinc finger-domain-containing protein [Xylariaceae sp. FL1019]
MPSPPVSPEHSDHFDSPSGTATVIEHTLPLRPKPDTTAGTPVDSDSSSSINPGDDTDNIQDTGLADDEESSQCIESNDDRLGSAMSDAASYEDSPGPAVEGDLAPTTEQTQLKRQASHGTGRNTATLESFRNILTAPLTDTAQFPRAEPSQAPSQYHHPPPPAETQSSRPSSSLNPIAPVFVPLQHTSREFLLPPWQPDQAVANCPICNVQFGMITRKHHCRKCGRVVCGQCSPHRICIPHQYIVRAPWEHAASRQPMSFGSEGGQRVRLCNPCVPDPNTTPPQAPQYTAPVLAEANSARHRRAHSTVTTSSAGTSLSSRDRQSAQQQYPGRNRSATTNLWPRAYDRPSQENGRRQPSRYGSRTDPSDNGMWLPSTDYIPFFQPGVPRVNLQEVGPHSPSFPAPQSIGHPGPSIGNPSLFTSAGPSQGRPYHGGSWASAALSGRPLPRRPAEIAEEDECPVCHLELPSRVLPNFEALRETHINNCIATTALGSYNARDESSVAAPGTHGTPPPRQARRTRMFPYKATEKDCVDNAECTICLEEFTAGEDMARLECFCRFHRSCIDSWFVGHPGRCPIHQHDDYGY